MNCPYVTWTDIDICIAAVMLCCDVDKDNDMNVIRHDDIFINIDGVGSLSNLLEKFIGNVPISIQFHFPIVVITKQTDSVKNLSHIRFGVLNLASSVIMRLIPSLGQ